MARFIDNTRRATLITVDADVWVQRSSLYNYLYFCTGLQFSITVSKKYYFLFLRLKL